MKPIDLWKLLLVLPLTFTLSTPVFAEDAPAAPGQRDRACGRRGPDSSDDGEAKEKEENQKPSLT